MTNCARRSTRSPRKTPVSYTHLVPTANELAATHRLMLRAIREDATYDPIRGEPRFQAALARLEEAVPDDG